MLFFRSQHLENTSSPIFIYALIYFLEQMFKKKAVVASQLPLQYFKDLLIIIFALAFREGTLLVI